MLLDSTEWGIARSVEKKRIDRSMYVMLSCLKPCRNLRSEDYFAPGGHVGVSRGDNVMHRNP